MFGAVGGWECERGCWIIVAVGGEYAVGIRALGANWWVIDRSTIGPFVAFVVCPLV